MTGAGVFKKDWRHKFSFLLIGGSGAAGREAETRRRSIPRTRDDNNILHPHFVEWTPSHSPSSKGDTRGLPPSGLQIAIRYLLGCGLTASARDRNSVWHYSDRARPFNSWLLERDNDLFEVVTRDYFFLCRIFSNPSQPNCLLGHWVHRRQSLPYP